VAQIAACGGKTAGTERDAGSGGPCTGGLDNDGDGHGVGCAAGPDCDDGDNTIYENCCADTEPHEGCACNPAVDQPLTCFDGTPAQAATPPCMKGTRSCDPGTKLWTPCIGQVAPVQEICDGGDNDCDGTADDGVLSMCGDCRPGCDQNQVGQMPFPLPGTPLPPGQVSVGADGVGLDPNGDLVLDQDKVEFHFLWVANDKEGTVSKLDTVTGKEVARYASVTHGNLIVAPGAGANNVPAWNADADANAYADNRPSRTAVDFYGNVWVANRAFGYQPSTTKIMNNPVDCVDRNMNGTIETSKEVNGTPGIQVNDPAEFFGELDECIAFTVKVGANDGVARALAIDAGSVAGDPGHAWVGMFTEQAFYQLDGKTGQLLKRVPPTGALGISPYGAAIDGLGRLWAPNGCCGQAKLVGINTVNGVIFQTGVVQTGVPTQGSYGIAVDYANRVWIGGWGNAMALRYDPAANTWTEVDIPGYFGQGWGARGLGADANKNIWVCLHQSADPFTRGAIARIDATTASPTGTWDLSVNSNGVAANVPVGCAVDFDGNVWSVNQSSSNASRLYIDPVTKTPAVNPATGHIVDTFPVGPNPYTYSDFTGFGLRNITRPQGDYKAVLEGCKNGDQAHWLSAIWDATVPPGTAVEIWVRSGDDAATIGAQPQLGPWLSSPGDLQMPPGPVPDGRFLELTIRLISNDRASTPIVHGYEIEWQCPQDIPG
jgi:streptogramin lyase